jgi:peptide/nickel transport system permease protein
MNAHIESKAVASPRAQRLLSLRSPRARRTLGCVLLFAAILVASSLVGESGIATHLESRHLPPSLSRLLGTDWLGRDMFTRVLLGLRLSLWVGFIAAFASAVLGITLGLVAGLGRGIADQMVGWLINLVMSLPHLVFQILIAFACGGGTKGVVMAVALTHWASLARVIRSEVQRIRSSDYVLLSAHLGQSKWWIARYHIGPQLLPQFLVGLILMFPHAISHEAALSFIGLGLSPHLPSMGIVLAESLRHLSTGYWWLAVCPGVALLITVKAFDVLGEDLRTLLTPRMHQDK